MRIIEKNKKNAEKIAMENDAIKTQENQEYLRSQLITYIGNKRALLNFIEKGVRIVQKKLNKEKLDCLDIFSGSGIVSRFLKQYSSTLVANDLEKYSYVTNKCYLANKNSLKIEKLKEEHARLILNVRKKMEDKNLEIPGFITKLYSPKNEKNIQKQDRCFYTNYNSRYIDIARQLIEKTVPQEFQDFFTAPLLSEASVHANTAGVFKGFYKNSGTGIGEFGGKKRDALSRITGKIQIPFPVFSNFNCAVQVFNKDANALATDEKLYAQTNDGTFDLAYLDPPYNQHPYASNYFMLNLIANYKEPDPAAVSKVSGIPPDWNRSAYNKKREIENVFSSLVKNVKAKYILVSFNSEGFIQKDKMISILSQIGNVQFLEANYNAFRGSRNLKNRNIHVKEYLFLVEKFTAE